LIWEFRKKEFPFYDNARVWKRKSDEWKIEAKNSPYVIKKEGEKVKIYRENYFFVDTWVLLNLIIAIIIFLLWPSRPHQRWQYFVIVLGFGRVYEYLIYQINAVLFTPEREKRKAREAGVKESPFILNPYRILILSILGYINLIIWFAVSYRFFEGLNMRDSLFFSFVTMTSFGQTSIYPTLFWSELLVFFQAVIGLFLIILVLANFISSLPRPKYYD
jgi:hypothetical protein